MLLVKTSVEAQIYLDRAKEEAAEKNFSRAVRTLDTYLLNSHCNEKGFLKEEAIELKEKILPHATKQENEQRISFLMAKLRAKLPTGKEDTLEIKDDKSLEQLLVEASGQDSSPKPA